MPAGKRPFKGKAVGLCWLLTGQGLRVVGRRTGWYIERQLGFNEILTLAPWPCPGFRERVNLGFESLCPVRYLIGSVDGENAPSLRHRNLPMS